MKDPIHVGRNGKKYLKSEYDFDKFLFYIVIIYVVLMISIMAVPWFVDPAGDDAYYLRVKNAYQTDDGYVLFGSLYQLESIGEGGLHFTGDENVTVPVTRFVYDEVNVGNMVSLDPDGEGYSYGGSISESRSSVYFTKQDHIDTMNEVFLWLIFMVGVVLIYHVWTKGWSRIMKITNFKPLMMDIRWYGRYLYGYANVDDSDNLELIKVSDTNLVMEQYQREEDEETPEMDFFTLRSRVTRFDDINEKIEKALDVHYDGKEQK